MTLYDYIKEIEEIIVSSTDEDGVISDDVMEKLDALELEKADKVDNCIKYYKSRKAMAEALKAEKMAIARRQQIAENDAERMRDYLAYCLGGEKWESIAGKVSYRKSKAVEIDDLEQIPEEYLKYDVKADKTAIKKELEQGATIIGCHLEENTSTIIK